MMAAALSGFLSLTVVTHREVRGVNQCKSWRGVRPIFIVVFDAPTMFNVVIDRRGANCNLRVSVSCEMVSVVSEEQQHVMQQFRY